MSSAAMFRMMYAGTAFALFCNRFTDIPGSNEVRGNISILRLNLFCDYPDTREHDSKSENSLCHSVEGRRRAAPDQTLKFVLQFFR